MRVRFAIIALSLYALTPAPAAWAQDFIWAKQMGGMLEEVTHSVTLDASGHVYTVGTFEGTVDFDPGPGTFNLSSAGHWDVFISKLDSDGNFLWAKRLGGSSLDEAGGVALDAGGNVYTVGRFEGTVDFDPGPGTFNLSSAGITDVFVSKLDSDGDFLWAKRMGGLSADEATGVALDASGNLYSVGGFAGTADFDPGLGTFNLIATGTCPGGPCIDVFVSKLDSNGNFVWAKRLGGMSYDFARDVALDAGGSVHTVGEFNGTADFDPGAGTFNLTAEPDVFCPGCWNDVFVSKLDSNGNFVWAKRMGGVLDEMVNGVALDASGNVYTVGGFNGEDGTADFDPGPGTFILTPVGDYDVFVSKLDSNGSFLWASRAGGADADFASGVALDAGGGVYTVGRFYLTADFGTFSLTSAGAFDVFVSKLDSNGNFAWAKRTGGANDDFAFGPALDAGGSVYTVGSFHFTADFDPGPGTFNLTSAAYSDAFAWKLGAVAAGDVADTLNVLNAPGGDITLWWANSCATSDYDYCLYEGVVGNWYSHGARFCSTGGSTMATFAPAAGNTYYLVVPRNTMREGSYGTASNGAPRPQGAAACAVQQMAQTCP